MYSNNIVYTVIIQIKILDIDLFIIKRNYGSPKNFINNLQKNS